MVGFSYDSARRSVIGACGDRGDRASDLRRCAWYSLPLSNLVTRREVHLFRTRGPSVCRLGYLAAATLRSGTGAAHVSPCPGHLPGAARRAHTSVPGDRCRRLGALVVCPGCGAEALAPCQRRLGTLYLHCCKRGSYAPPGDGHRLSVRHMARDDRQRRTVSRYARTDRACPPKCLRTALRARLHRVCVECWRAARDMEVRERDCN